MVLTGKRVCMIIDSYCNMMANPKPRVILFFKDIHEKKPRLHQLEHDSAHFIPQTRLHSLGLVQSPLAVL